MVSLNNFYTELSRLFIYLKK